jgi:phosphate:Na+ symporter
MTTIGLVSAGLLTFPQGLGLVFGANVGSTGWLIALIGVRVSLTPRHHRRPHAGLQATERV